jgi:hypothetical protein
MRRYCFENKMHKPNIVRSSKSNILFVC